MMLHTVHLLEESNHRLSPKPSIYFNTLTTLSSRSCSVALFIHIEKLR